MNKYLRFFLLFFIILGGALIASPVLALGELIKSDISPAVYYLDGANVRHLFPTGPVYKTWYQDYSGIKVLSNEDISQYPLGKNVTVRSGLNIVTFATDPNFYAVEPGGVFRRFEDEEVIAEIYGADWLKRVIELPEGFFDDYVMGEKIKYNHDLPDGIVYKLVSDGKYYYKNNGLIQPFKNWQSIVANNFKMSDVVYNSVELNKRKKEITGLDSNIFNPVAKPKVSTADCENKKFKVAFVLITKDTYQPKEIDKLNLLKNRLETNFKWATNELAEIDVSFPIVILSDNQDLFFTDTDGQLKPDNEVINIFYDQNQDIFDFIILYNNFVLNETVMANYLTLTNDFAGTGNAIMHSAYNFGSQGKLKGVANMGNLEKYNIDIETEINRSINYIIHELLHHFSGRAIFENDGEISYALLDKPNRIHWNMYVDFVSPLGGNGWQDNGDSTFTNKITLMADSAKKPLTDLDLYFMGLLPKQVIDPIYYLAPDEAGIIGNVIAGELKEVTIDQIVDVMGNWRCRI